MSRRHDSSRDADRDAAREADRDADRPLRAVTFDVTHTLLHAPRLVEIYAEVLRRHHGPGAVDADELARLLPTVWTEFDCAVTPPACRFTHHDFAGHPAGSRGFWSRYLERLCEYLDLEASPFAAAELFDRFAHADAWEVYADVPDALGELTRRGLRLGVISNWDERLPGLLAELGLARHFDAVVVSAEIGVEKPHRAPFHLALERLGVAAEETLHVGDSQRHDVEGARAVGMDALCLDRGPGARVPLFDLLRPRLPPPPASATGDRPGDRHRLRLVGSPSDAPSTRP